LICSTFLSTFSTQFCCSVWRSLKYLSFVKCWILAAVKCVWTLSTWVLSSYKKQLPAISLDWKVLQWTVPTVLLNCGIKRPVIENREYGRRDPSRWLRGTLCPHKLAITSSTNGGRSVGIVRSRTQTMEFSFSFLVIISILIFCMVTVPRFTGIWNISLHLSWFVFLRKVQFWKRLILDCLYIASVNKP
jgi:hypothetical protein